MDETPKENRWLSAPLRQRPSKEKDQGGDEIFSFPLKSGVAKFETKRHHCGSTEVNTFIWTQV